MYKPLYLVLNWSHWTREKDIDYYPQCDEPQQYMYGWHNANLFPLPLMVRRWAWIENTVRLGILIQVWPRIDSPNSSRFCKLFRCHPADDSKERVIWHIAITRYVVFAVIRFLAAARSGAVGVACLYPWMVGSGCGVLVPLPAAFCREVGDIGFLQFFLFLVLALSLP